MNLTSQSSSTGAISGFLRPGRRCVDEMQSRLVCCGGQAQFNRRASAAISAARRRDEEYCLVGALGCTLKYLESQWIEAAANAGSPNRALPRAEQHRQQRLSCKPLHYARSPLCAPNRMGPNTSFEATATGGRRRRVLHTPVAPVSAPQLKRSAPGNS